MTRINFKKRTLTLRTSS
uniref:Uncharacterized protein n=1 Tax=Arundo donax TaxID=35708 RepID=A0A0A9BFH7_ARUDO